MRTYQLSARARHNLIEILDYLDQHSFSAADKVEQEILDGLSHIAQFPNSGFVRPEISSASHRIWLVHPYLVVYNPETNPITIVSITHGARDIASGLNQT